MDSQGMRTETEEQFDQFSDQLLECYHEISALQETSEVLGQLVERETIARTALRTALRVTRATRGAFFAQDEEGQWAALAATDEINGTFPSGWALFLQDRQTPLIENHPTRSKLPDVDAVAPGFSNLLVTPLVAQSGIVGILSLFDARGKPFHSTDAKMVHAIARQAATALSNQEHHRKLMRAQEDLLLSHKFAAMGEMAAEIGHELNNYLTSILGQVEIMKILIEKRTSEGWGNRLSTIITQVDKMAVLTQGLLRCSRQEIRPAECRLQDIVRETVAFVRPQNRFDHVEFEVEVPQDLPSAYWDPNQMQQVFLNLFTNAADAMGESGGTISVSARLTAQTQQVEILVSDEGPGIPEEYRQRVFEPRFTTKTQGNGFGLAVCFRIVQEHGGAIRLESPSDLGATFVITLPLRPDNAAQVDPKSV